MSSLSQFAPFAAGGLKSFQTGFLTQTTTTSPAVSGEDRNFRDVTVSAVNTAKTITAFQGSGAFNTDSQLYSSGTSINTIMTTRMTSSTNLRVATQYSMTQMISAGRWQVAEAN
jgi:hypothetical protein